MTQAIDPAPTNYEQEQAEQLVLNSDYAVNSTEESLEVENEYFVLGYN